MVKASRSGLVGENVTNERGELLVKDAEAYLGLMDISEQLETIEAVRPAIEEMKAGKGESADEVLAQLKTRNLKLKNL